MKRPLQQLHSLSRRYYHDQTLQWARDNPVIAQGCLNLPPIDLKLIGTSSSLPVSFRDYWQRRGWQFPVQQSKDLSLGQSLSTHVLSAPLTVSRLLLNPISSSGRWCVLGARAEASLPFGYWKELLLLHRWLSEEPVEVQIDFVGPDLQTRPTIMQILDERAVLELTWPFTGKFHEYRDCLDVDYDAYILLNPGLGHGHLQKDWEPTLELLLQRPHSRLLLTAHSLLDANRDAEVLADYLGQAPVYEENPFASQITYADPFDASHMVRPNHYVVELEL